MGRPYLDARNAASGGKERGKRMRTRRRREPVFWLPVLGTASTTSTKPDTDYNSASVGVTATRDDITTVIRQPFDTWPLDGGSVSPGFPGDIIYATAQEWFLKRIVGKIWCNYGADGLGSPPSLVLASAGLFVSKSGGAGGGVVPTTYDASIDYGVSAITTTREPWIWRRSWILQDDTAGLRVDQAFPRSNAFYGSVLDGPHVDAKTKRRISNDDDVHLALSAVPLNGGTATGTVAFWWELRGLASSRKPHNRGTF